MRKSVGIEIHDERHQFAKRFETSEADGRELRFRNENFVQSDLSDATVIFTCSAIL